MCGSLRGQAVWAARVRTKSRHHGITGWLRSRRVWRGNQFRNWVLALDSVPGTRCQMGYGPRASRLGRKRDKQMNTDTTTTSDGLIPADVLASTTPVAAYVTASAKAGKEQELEAHLKSIISLVRAEQGYEQYASHTRRDEPGTFAFYERWSSGADMLRHVQQPFMVSYFETLMNLLDGPLEMSWLRPLEA